MTASAVTKPREKSVDPVGGHPYGGPQAVGTTQYWSNPKDCGVFMTAWISRNVMPIALVLAASGAVIGLFEILDAMTQSTPQVVADYDAATDGSATIAGLFKVAIFLGIGTLVAIPLRRRFERSKAQQS